MNLTSKSKSVQTAILLYLLVFAGLNLGVWLWFAAHRHVPGHHFPLGERIERFGDLLRFTGKYQIGKDPRIVDSEHLVGTLFPKNYPAFSVVIYMFLLGVCAPYAMPVMAAIVVGGMVAACTVLWRRCRKFEGYAWFMGLAIFATGLFGWGTEMILMRGNIEGIMWLGVCLGAALYARRRYTGAAIAIAVAACVKPYPVLWFGLMARQRRYRQVVIGLLAMVLVTLGSLMVIDRNPVRAYHTISAKSQFFEDYVVSFRPMEEMKGDHSLFQSMKTIARVVRNHGLNFSYLEWRMHPSDPLAWKLYYAYLPLAAVVGLVTLWRVWNKPVLNQMFAVACISTLLPMVAADYTLSVILIPMGFFLVFLLEDVAEGRARMSLGQMLWFLVPCAYIMGPEPLALLLHGVFKTVAILVLLGATLSIPLPSTTFKGTVTG